MKTGKITQISGPVLDVEFPDGDPPAIKEALTVTTNGKTRYMEVAFHVGNNVVRCIMFAETEGLARGAEVVATGSGISVTCAAGAEGFRPLPENVFNYRPYFIDNFTRLCYNRLVRE